MVDTLADGGDEGRVRLRKVSGSRQKALIRKYPNGETQYIAIYITLYGSERCEVKHLSSNRKRNQTRFWE